MASEDFYEECNPENQIVYKDDAGHIRWFDSASDVIESWRDDWSESASKYLSLLLSGRWVYYDRFTVHNNLGTAEPACSGELLSVHEAVDWFLIRNLEAPLCVQDIVIAKNDACVADCVFEGRYTVYFDDGSRFNRNVPPSWFVPMTSRDFP